MKKYFWLSVILVGVIVLIILGVSVLVYGVRHQHWDSPFVRTVAKTLRLSAARVGTRSIPYTDYLIHVDAVRQFLSGPAARAQGYPPELTPDLRAEALDRAIRIAAVEEFAEQRQVIITSLDVDRGYDVFLETASSTPPEQIRNFIRDGFGWNEEQFKRYVVRPTMIEDRLNKKKLLETKDAQAFQTELQTRLSQPDVVRYLKF